MVEFHGYRILGTIGVAKINDRNASTFATLHMPGRCFKNLVEAV